MAEKKKKVTLPKPGGRPRPSAPKSGFKDGRYNNGGKISRKKGS